MLDTSADWTLDSTNMFDTLAAAVTVRSSLPRLDARAWRAVLMETLDHSGEGLVLCDASLRVIFATDRGSKLLEAIGSAPGGQLGPTVREIVERHLREGDSVRTERIAPDDGKAAVYLQCAKVRSAGRELVTLRLRAEVLRDERLHAVLTEKFALSPRSLQMVPLIRKGLTNRQIGAELGLAESTVKTYVYQLFRDCDVPNRTSLVALIEELASNES